MMNVAGRKAWMRMGVERSTTRTARTVLAQIMLCAAAVFASPGELPGTNPKHISFGVFGREPSVIASGPVSCNADTECDDGNACSADSCIAAVCAHDSLADCVPCDGTQVCAPLEVVFVMDTSGSMVDQAAALCSQSEAVLDALEGLGITVNHTFLGITRTPAGPFSCLSGNVLTLFGGDEPGGSEVCGFPAEPSSQESWGPATTILADRFAWTPGSLRVIIPLGDESPCNGDGPSRCNDPGDDRDAVAAAITAAQNRDVIVSPIIGSGAGECTLRLARDLAEQTGGAALQSMDPGSDLTDALTKILVAACVMAEQCDDQNPCTEHDLCSGGICSGALKPNCRLCTEDADCDDTIACTTDRCANTECLNSVTSSCVPCTTALDCNDGNLCTADLCKADLCDNPPSFDSAVSCCVPATGIIAPINDSDECTLDACNIITGQITHTPVSPNSICDDDDSCTLQDRCNALGQCAGVEAETVSCSSDAECSPGVCDEQTGHCDCGDVPLLRLQAAPTPSLTECLIADDELEIRIEVGFSRSLLSGGQFLVGFDPDVLEFISADPGQAADAHSPFTVEFSELLDAANGRIFQAVGVASGQPGAQGPALLAVMRFRVIAPCSSDELCFFNRNPQTTLLTDSDGMTVPFRSACTGLLTFDDGPPELSCPQSHDVNADAGEVTAVISWNTVTVRDECEDVDLICTSGHEAGANVAGLLARGGRFPQGLSEFSCQAVDSCGNESRCDWHVDVSDANGVDVALQLSPTMLRGPLMRCIEFEFFANCVEGPAISRQVVEFGGPFELAGRASHVQLKIPPDRYECVTARDPLHTVRSVAELTVEDHRYVAEFQGDPFFGGNWLVGGNLDESHVIDIVDFGIFVSQYLTHRDAHTDCGRPDRNADLNGDGLVDQFDFTFIRRNFLSEDNDSCCPGNVAAKPEATTSISIEELQGLGLGDLSMADLNRDGQLDEQDLAAFQSGARPIRPRAPKNPRR